MIYVLLSRPPRALKDVSKNRGFKNNNSYSANNFMCKGSAWFYSRYRETWPGSSLSSRRAPRQRCHGRGANFRPPAPQADALPKELSRQLISWLFVTSTWPEASAAFGPLHGRPSACGVTHGLKLGCRPNSPCKCSKSEPLASPRVFESGRGHHYRETWPGSSLSSRRAPRQTCHGRGANLRPPAPQADALPKELSRQLISWLFRTSTWPEAGAAFGPLHRGHFFRQLFFTLLILPGAVKSAVDGQHWIIFDTFFRPDKRFRTYHFTGSLPKPPKLRLFKATRPTKIQPV